MLAAGAAALRPLSGLLSCDLTSEKQRVFQACWSAHSWKPTTPLKGGRCDRGVVEGTVGSQEERRGDRGGRTKAVVEGENDLMMQRLR